MPVTLRRQEISWGSIFGVFQFLVLPSLAQYINLFLQLPLWGLQIAMFAVNFIGTVVIFRRYLWDNCKVALRSPLRFLGYTALCLALYYTATFVVGYFNLQIRPDYANLNDAEVTELVKSSGIWFTLSTVVLVPVAEECLFRGLLFRGVYERRKWLAWVLSAGLFSAVHVLSYLGSYDGISTLLAFIQYLPAGLTLCYAYRKSGTILAPILMHGLINLISTYILT